MIRKGYIDVLFAGNALPTHDIEYNLYGTSLGMDISTGKPGDGRPQAPPLCHQRDHAGRINKEGR